MAYGLGCIGVLGVILGGFGVIRVIDLGYIGVIGLGVQLLAEGVQIVHPALLLRTRASQFKPHPPCIQLRGVYVCVYVIDTRYKI
jgi:hypothetical protein